ncbi:olfactory receptor 13C2-like [Menidia menidia]
MDVYNGSLVTLSGHVEINTFRYLYFSFMFAVYTLIICSSSTILYIIWIHKDLHEPMYIFIAALLFNSTLYSTVVYPKLLIDFLSEKQVISYSACLFQLFMFYSVGGSEYLLLGAMAYDRYVSICKPLRYPTLMGKNTVTTFLVLSWVIPACHIAVQVFLCAQAKLCSHSFKGIFCNNSILTLLCERSKLLTAFGVVTLLDVGILPVLFTVFTYTKIFIISYQSCKEFRGKAFETCLPHLLVLIGFTLFSSYDVFIARVESDFPQIARFVMTLQIILYHPLFNPFMYGLKMKEISKHLKRLFLSTKK